MAVSQAQKLAKTKYREEKREQMTVEMPKGRKEIYKAGAAKLGLSLSLFIQNAAEEYAQNHGGEVIQPSATKDTDKLTSEEKALLAVFNELPEDTRKNFLKGFKTINQLLHDALSARAQSSALTERIAEENAKLREENKRFKQNQPE